MDDKEDMEVEYDFGISLELENWLISAKLANEEVRGALLDCGIHSMLGLLKANNRTLSVLTNQLKTVQKKKFMTALESCFDELLQSAMASPFKSLYQHDMMSMKEELAKTKKECSQLRFQLAMEKSNKSDSVVEGQTVPQSAEEKGENWTCAYCTVINIDDSSYKDELCKACFTPRDASKMLCLGCRGLYVRGDQCMECHKPTTFNFIPDQRSAVFGFNFTRPSEDNEDGSPISVANNPFTSSGSMDANAPLLPPVQQSLKRPRSADLESFVPFTFGAKSLFSSSTPSFAFSADILLSPTGLAPEFLSSSSDSSTLGKRRHHDDDLIDANCSDVMPAKRIQVLSPGDTLAFFNVKQIQES